MIPIEQRILHSADSRPAGGDNGDCLRACLASILRLPYEQVPHFAAYDDHRWWNECVAFLRSHGFNVWRFGLHGDERPTMLHGNEETEYHVVIPGYWLASVLSPRGTDDDGTPIRHLVVMYGDRVAWDPHPQREQGHLGFEEAWILVPGLPLGEEVPG